LNPNDTNMRALVPYVAPKKHFLISLYNYIQKSSAVLHTFFYSRRKTYLFFLSLFSFGIILGAYYSHIHGILMPLVDFLTYALPLIVLAFLCGLTMFGLVVAPLCSLTLAFLCGTISQNVSVIDANYFLRISLLCVLAFCCNLFFSESFLTSVKAGKGYKNALLCKSFVAFIVEFLITICFLFLLANTF